MNRRTASAGELMICALVQNGIAGQVTIVGSGTTPGKGIGQAEYDILDGKAQAAHHALPLVCAGRRMAW